MNVNNISIQVDDAEYGTEYATFNSWIYGIMRSGFGTPSMAELNAYTEQLKVVYEKSHTKKVAHDISVRSTIKVGRSQYSQSFL